VSGDSYQELGVKSLADGGFGLGPAVGSEVVEPRSGSLKALSELTSVTLPDMQRRLDVFAQALVAEVNALHRTGYNAAGETNIDFFDPAGITAGSIDLSQAVLESPDAIAAGLTAEPGDNDLALELAALGGRAIDMLGDRTFSEFYSSFAASVGSSVRDSAQQELSSKILLDNAEARRASVSGVSVDEEMINLIGQQEAYTAAARLIGVADAMVQEILNLV
jgi:flagellar hook-associated protein 1 FlgK